MPFYERSDEMISTGLKGLDRVINGLRLGDNVVWQMDSVDDYMEFVGPFVKKALQEKRRVVYIRFANHKNLFEGNKDIGVYRLDAHLGFETFSSEVNNIIKKEGEGVFYVFDCLSDLLSAWSNDLMIGNFFKITCPYLFELNTIAYFALLRNNHSFKTVARIRDTTQLLIDVYHYGGNCYIHPLKVWNRYSPTMFLPHVRRSDGFVAMTSSVDTARLFSRIFKKTSKSAARKLDYWDRLFMTAEELATRKETPHEKKEAMVDQLSRLIIARDEKMLHLARRYLTLEDFLTIKSRMIGTGFIGGKSVGMLIARNIIQRDESIKSEKFFEPHDSFYIGSDVFYTYIVENGWWKARMEQRTKEGYFEVARTLRDKLLTGTFPDEIKEQFQQMIEYFGQSPIIVRSSSLLEDSYGNAFAGKYESVFLPNQGNPDERYAKFVDAVRRIYASTLNEDALVYRLQRGLDQMDEQMALLVQRVSGAYHKDFFFPDAAGVGISYNAFVWNNAMDPRAGMLRLVLGLGTRAVNRVEGDYPRIVALDNPLLKAHSDIKDARRYSQHEVDVLNIKENIMQTISLRELLIKKVNLNLEFLATKDYQATEKLLEMGSDEEAWIIDFDNLLSNTNFTEIMRNILHSLETAYGYPIDIEFTVNFVKNNKFRINILQCRPMQTKGLGHKVIVPKHIAKKDIIFQTRGNFLSGNISQKVDRIIYVDPKGYCGLASLSEKYDIARLVGVLNRQIGSRQTESVMLLGPGRWGTTTPSLGVPVSFAEINNMAILGEIAFASENISPEISFGTHFFKTSSKPAYSILPWILMTITLI
ncbi:MAG: PEP/pyruvate-binding domain-containing protein [Candidatus Omnitrophica bacterium]|nr:PEP/pyruvate-binding domain-containing protein [Candidatus Omnitrophota bacterium]